MNKLSLLLILMLVTLGVFAAPALAVPTDDLNSMAQYFPDNTPVLVSLRIDDAYIDSLDSLIARVASAMPEGERPDSIRKELDKAVKEILREGNFQSEVRSWLGDVMSVGVMSLEGAMGRGGSDEDTPPFLAAAPVTNRAAAELFFARIVRAGDGFFTKTTQGDFSIFTPEDEGGVVAVGNDVLFVANSVDELPLQAPDSPLSESATFIDTMKLLPVGDYNITAFLNLGDTIQKGLESSEMSSDERQMLGMFMPLFGNFPTQAIGATVLDGRAMTIDFAQSVSGVMDSLKEMGLDFTPPGAVDPAFAARIPAGVPLVAHGTGLNLSFEQALAQLRLMGKMQAESGGQGGVDSEELERGLQQAKFFIQGLTGLDLEKDIIPALDGDYALFAGLSPAATDVRTPQDLMKQMPFEFGLILEVSNPEVTTGIIKGVQQVLQNAQEVTTEFEETDGVQQLLITVSPSNDTPFPLELVLAGNNEILYFGTRNAARVALNADGGLPTDPSYTEARAYLLDAPNTVLYLASEGLKPLVDITRVIGGDSIAARDSEQFAALLSLVSSATITSSYQDGVQYGRAVWTLPQE